MRITQPLLSLHRVYSRRTPIPRGRGVFMRLIRGLHRLGAPLPLITGEEGVRLEFAGRDLLLIEVFDRQSWEPEETRLLARLVPPGAVVIDVGANVGYYTLLAAKWAGQQGRVYAVEPVTRTYDQLLRNLRVNHAANVTAVNEACAAVSGTGRMALFGDSAWSRLSSGDDGTEPVRVTTIDDLARRHGLRRLDLLKIDAEGADFDVLRGASETIGRFRPAVFMEVHALENGRSISDVTAFLTPFGYRFTTLSNRFSTDLLCTPDPPTIASRA